MTFYSALLLLFLISFIVCLFFLTLWTVFQCISWLKGAPYVSTDSTEIPQILSKIPIKKGCLFVELGCGDGRVARCAVAEYKALAVGYDINPVVLFIARFKSWLFKIPVKYFQKDIQNADLDSADVIYLFLFPKLISKIDAKLLSSVNRGALVISRGFKIPFLNKYLVSTFKGSVFKTYYYKLIN